MKVERVEMKDVRLPVQLQRAMAAEAEATREAGAKVRLIVVQMMCDPLLLSDHCGGRGTEGVEGVE